MATNIIEGAEGDYCLIEDRTYVFVVSPTGRLSRGEPPLMQVLARYRDAVLEVFRVPSHLLKERKY